MIVQKKVLMVILVLLWLHLDKQSADIAMGVDKALEAKEGVDKED